MPANLNEWWLEREKLSALQRLSEFFGDILLTNIDGRIVVFVDEIDTTIALPFTDDFFAAIRACYSARATKPAYQRLSFVLLGVTSPSDLIKNPQRTPFNVGYRLILEILLVRRLGHWREALAPELKSVLSKCYIGRGDILI